MVKYVLLAAMSTSTSAPCVQYSSTHKPYIPLI